MQGNIYLEVYKHEILQLLQDKGCSVDMLLWVSRQPNIVQMSGDSLTPSGVNIGFSKCVYTCNTPTNCSCTVHNQCILDISIHDNMLYIASERAVCVEDTRRGQDM